MIDTKLDQPQVELVLDRDKVASMGLDMATVGADGLVRLYRAGAGAETFRIPNILNGHTDTILGVQFSPDNRRLVTAGADQTARIWDVGSGREIAHLVGHANQVTDAAYSPDGRFIVTSSNDHTAILWDAGVGRAEDDLRGHVGAVTDAHFSSDGNRVVTAGEDNTVRAQVLYLQGNGFQAVQWPYGKYPEGTPLANQPPYDPGRVAMFVFLPDKGKTLQDFYAELTPENWQAWMGKFEPVGVKLAMPKFEYKFQKDLSESLAEREGFEPSIRCRIHTFQACAFDHSANSPMY